MKSTNMEKLFPIDFCQQYFSWVVLLFFRFGEEESPTFKLADRYNMKFPDFTLNDNT